MLFAKVNKGTMKVTWRSDWYTAIKVIHKKNTEMLNTSNPTPATPTAAVTAVSMDALYRQLDEILENKRKFPATAEEFCRYLTTIFSEENYEFLQAVRQLRETSKKQEMRDGTATKEESNPLLLTTDTEAVFNRFVPENSERQINISNTMRQQCIERFEQDPMDIDGVFSPPEAEVKKLLITQRCIQGFERYLIPNINKQWQRKRWMQTIGNLTAGFILSILLLCLVNSIRWLRILAIPFFWRGLHWGVNVSQGLCPVGGAAGVRTNDKGAFVKIEDEVILNVTRALVKRNDIIAVVGAIVIIIAFTAIPTDLF
jgi:hypothetical protein